MAAKNAKPAQLALLHFEKLILGGLCFSLLAAWGFAAPDPTAEAADLDREMRLVGAHMKRGQPQPVPSGDQVVADLEQRLSEVPHAESFPAWMAHRRPGVLTQEKPWQDLHGELGQLTLSTTLLPRSVRLSWKEPSHSDFLLLRYRLERQLDQGPWEFLAPPNEGEASEGEAKEEPAEWEPKEGVFSYEDTNLRVRVAARYRLSLSATVDSEAITRHARSRRRLKLALADTSRKTEASASQTLRQDVFLIPRTIWVEDALNRKPGRAYVTVYVRTKDGFRKKGFPVEVEGAIGERVAVGRRSVDFRSEAVLVEVREEVTEGLNGRKIRTGVIKVRWPEGTLEEITTKAKPPE